jgi:hypothetical protein
MQNAKTYNAKEHGFLCGVLGLPGSGKSTFIRSALSQGKSYLALAPASELDSYGGVDTDYEVFEDLEWQPSQGKWNATAWQALMTRIYSLQESDYRVVGFDTVSTLQDLAWHECMKLHQTEDPTKIGGNSYGPYTALRGKLIEFLQACQVLAARGKYVFTAWHVTSKESEGAGVPTKQAGELRWDEQLLPDIRSGLRSSIAGKHSLWLYCQSLAAGKNTSYQLLVLPDKYRPARARAALAFKDGVTTIPNRFDALLDALK